MDRHYPLNAWNPDRGFSKLVQQLIKFHIKNDMITRWEFFATLASVSMVEAGFVPVSSFTEKPFYTVEDLMRMTLEDRYLKLLQLLLDILRDTYTLRNVLYKLILAVPSADNNIPIRYEYSTFTATLASIFDKNLSVLLVARDFEVYHVFTAENYLHIPNTLDQQRFLWYRYVEDKLDAAKFSRDFKYNVAFMLTDAMNAYCPEIRLLDQVPTEMILDISKYLDMRSCVNLGMTCKRFNDVLNNNDEVWKKHLQRIPRDFPAYGLPVPENIAPETVGRGYQRNKRQYMEHFSTGIRNVHRNLLPAP